MYVLAQGGYDHYMQKEIHEQPESILQSMRGRVNIRQKEVSACVHRLPSLSLEG
jgi:glucosamine 6-phosphate synthetase-like amidotransferase/phosphosugar isomerase protein